eukprot:s41_g31.t1
MDRRRRQRGEGGETADERLDRLIQMERRCHEGSELQGAAIAPEVRRLVVTDGGARAAGAVSVPPGDGGRTNDLAAGGALLPLQPGPELPAPDGMLVPLFHGLGDDEGRQLQSEEPRNGGLVDAGIAAVGVMVQNSINPFWSPNVRHEALVEGSQVVPRPDSLPRLAGPPRVYGPSAFGDGGPVQALGDHPQLPNGPVQALGDHQPQPNGPVQALGDLRPQAAGSVQAVSLASAGPVQALGDRRGQPGETMALRFALEGLSKWDLHRVHSDTALLMKQIGLYLKAEEKRIEVFGDGMVPTEFVLESPEDPMSYLGSEKAATLPSFWNFPELQGMVGVGGLKLISLDQSETGHARQKPTSLLENLPGLDQLDELRSSGRKADPLPDGIQASIAASKDWAAWSPGLVEAIKRSLLVYLQQREKCLDQLPSAKKMNIEDWKAHIRAQHRPYRRD